MDDGLAEVPMPIAGANGLEICYETRGEGPPIVLVMGLAAQLIHWPEGFCDELVARGHRVIRFDNRDVGRSSKLDDARVPHFWRTLLKGFAGFPISVPYRLSDMAADVAGLLDALALESAHIVGISMGGMIAQVVAIEHPTRVRTLTSMMSTTGARRYLGKPRAIRALLGPAPKSRDEAMDRAVEFYRVVSGRYAIDVDEIRERAGHAFDRGHNPWGYARQILAVVASGSRARALEQVSAPTLVIHGAADPLVPAAAGRATARAIPAAKLHIVDGLGHHLPKEAWPHIIPVIAEHVASYESAHRRG